MKKTTIAAAAFALTIGGAIAQSTINPPPANNTMPPASATPSTTPPAATAPAATPPRTNPGATAPGANTGSPTSGTATGSSNPAVNPSGNTPSGVNASGQATIVPIAALENGANSFTEGQARTRLEGAGLTSVTELAKDDQGIWRGKAMRSGQSVTVGFDYKGNIGVQ